MGALRNARRHPGCSILCFSTPPPPTTENDGLSDAQLLQDKEGAAEMIVCFNLVGRGSRLCFATCR